jgi:curved DNA-binding protein CbpA
MIRTLMVGQEYMASARAAGIYSHLLSYIARVQAGERPAPLPGEMAMTAVTQTASHRAPLQQLPTGPPPSTGPQMQVTSYRAQNQIEASRPAAQVVKGRRNEKALNYFQSCLAVLGLEEEVALTEDALKKAYKKAAIRAHPDKGGTEEEFEAITRAHAYLGEIIRRVKGGRDKEGVVEAPNRLRDTRETAAAEWKMVDPVRLNPKKLDLNLFNQMFEQTRIPDPEEDGYGDWLKGSDDGAAGSTAPKFSGKFNRDVFNQMFEEDARGRGAQSQALAVRQPEALTLAPTHGVELGRTGGGGYTAAPNANLKFTDLRSAYTVENTITNQVADVRVEARSFDQYSASRKKAPEPLSNRELEAIAAADAAMAKREKQRQIRAAQEDSLASQYFERMKRLVITNN